MMVERSGTRSKSMHHLHQKDKGLKAHRMRYYTHDVKIKRNSNEHKPKQMTVDLDETDAEQMGFISRKRKVSKSKTKSLQDDGDEGGGMIDTVESEAGEERNSKKKSSVYTQYKMRKNEQQ